MADFPQFDGMSASCRPLGQYVTFPLTPVLICLKSKMVRTQSYYIVFLDTFV